VLVFRTSRVGATIVSEWPFSQAPGSAVVAHRGDPTKLPENTLEGFDSAVRAGADAVEFDVRMTADGVAVVMHDAEVDRTTDGMGLVRSMTLEEVRSVAIPLPGGGAAGVPTLEEALRSLAGRAAVDIEIKNVPGDPDFDPDREEAVEATIAALDATGFDGAVIVSSFNPLSIARCRDLAPTIPTGLLTDPTVEAEAGFTFAKDQGHAWLLAFADVVTVAPDGFIERVHASGMRLGTWVTDDPTTAVALMRRGVDAVATNDPGLIVAARSAAFGG
jgi:glycerophosphoryl diester phosphodiesterase